MATKVKNSQVSLTGTSSVAIAQAGFGSEYYTSATTPQYFDSTNFKAVLNVKYGKTIVCHLSVSGWWHTNASYPTYFDIGVDGNTTRSNSGSMTMNVQGGAATDGSKQAQMTFSFVFTNLSAGNHTFYPLWWVGNAANTSKLNTWSMHHLVVYEVMPAII